MKRTIGLGVSAVAALGAGALAAAMVAAHISQASHWFAGVCNVDATFLGIPLDCDTVNNSRYAELFGIPLAVLGTGLYAVMLGLAGRALIRSDSRATKANQLLVSVAVLAFLYSVVLLLIQLFKINAVCPLCLILYTCQLLVLGGSLVATDFALGTAFRETMRLLVRGHLEPLVWGSALGFVVVIAGLQITGAVLGNVDELDPEELSAKLDSAVRIELSPRDDDAATGPVRAPYVIIEFSDFMCPFCRRAAAEARALKEEMPYEVRLIFKHYPLDDACNPMVRRKMHPGACDAAAAAICAGVAGKFWEFHDALFARQEQIFSGDVRRNLLLEAEGVGISASSMSECMDSPDTRARLRADIDDAIRIGVRGTPAFIFNGRSLFSRPLQMGAGGVAIAKRAIAADLLKP